MKRSRGINEVESEKRSAGARAEADTSRRGGKIVASRSGAWLSDT